MTVGPSAKGRLRSDSHDFVEATFDTAGASRNSTSPPLLKSTASPSPLYAPHFPIPTDNSTATTATPAAPPVASTSTSRHVVLSVQSPTDTSAIEMNTIARRPGPLRNLPTALYADAAAAATDDGNDSEKPANRGSVVIDRAAAAGVAVTTPPAVNDDQWYRDQIDYVRTQVEQMENLEVQRGQEAKRIRSKWKRDLFLLFEDPSSSIGAFIINIFVTFMIIFSAVLTTVETIPSLHKGNAHVWLALELTIVAIFTLEFVLRFLGHTDTWRQAWNHGKSFITIIDALAIFPFYIELALSRNTAYEFRFTILRIFRLLRVFSAFKYSSLLQLSIEVMIVAIKRSSDALLAFLLFVTLTVLLFSTLMYFAERGTWNEEREAFLTENGEYSKFSSIPAAAYYSIVTLTTTGFGDMVPTTFFGKLVSFPMMISGILLIALPSIIVGRNFTQVWEAARKYRFQRSASRAQHPGESLVDADDTMDIIIGAPNGDSNSHHSDAHSSSRASRRSRKQRLRNRTSATTMSKRDGSISSFESGPPRSFKQGGGSPADMSGGGGYATVSGGQRELAGHATGSYDYARSSDPIDALARKDSFEMQVLASRASDPEEHPDGYTHIETMYDSDASSRHAATESDHNNSDAVGASSRRRRHRRRASRVPRSLKRSRRAEAAAVGSRGRKGKETAALGSVDPWHSSDSSNTEDIDGTNTIRVSRLEWESLNAELAALRSVIGSNSQVLCAIAQHLAVPNIPSHFPPSHRHSNSSTSDDPARELDASTAATMRVQAEQTATTTRQKTKEPPETLN
ncbi:hypothetical protein IW140_005164 [Coemansia sp. RSA 1813]|nr:hypothetical protein LPJ74_003820 [Coemansia sp. RSA 1843]KAJ2213463.1 hypothetical protein EV179_003782 [Coemansia sp. RSA 487]KAJ2565822.1 hypothetical protein IW140_005164 [Coemansia sp. RSA 1813]